MEISSIPESVGKNELEEKVLKVFTKIFVPFDSSFVEDCHRISFGKIPRKVTIKLTRCKGVKRVFDNESKLKNFDSTLVSLLKIFKIFIQESQCLDHKTPVKM